MKNVFYFKDINYIGGVESWFWYLSKLYKNIVIYYKTGHPEQIKRLSQNVEVRRYTGKEIVCDNFFCCYNPDIINNVKAKHKYHVVHCDYKNVWFPPILNDEFDGYIGVSKIACDSFTELTGLPCELMYNPISIETPKVEKYNDGKLHLISATRLTKEKGLKRMQKLGKILDKSGIPYVWEVYSNRHREAIGNNVIYKEPKMDILEDIAKADYLVQLSDCESYCYSIVESLMVGTPIIVTDLPVLKELGVKHGKNAVICDFKMNNVQLDIILKKCLKFDYTPPKSNWNKYLDNNSSYDPNDKTMVKILKGYTDLEIGRLNKGQEVEMAKKRASYLESRELVEWLY